MRYIFSLDDEISAEEQTQLDATVEAVRLLRSALEDKIPAPKENILGAPVGYYRDLESHDPPADAAALGLPTLVLQGKRDYQVTLEDFELWQAALTGKPHACLLLYDGLDHLFRKGEGRSGPHDYTDRATPVDSGVLDDIAAWIRTGQCPS